MRQMGFRRRELGIDPKDFLKIYIKNADGKRVRVETDNILMTVLTDKAVEAKIRFKDRDKVSLGDQSSPDVLEIEVPKTLKDVNNNPIDTNVIAKEGDSKAKKEGKFDESEADPIT